MAGGCVRTLWSSGGWWRRLVAGAALTIGLGACFSSSHHATPTTRPTVTTVVRPSTTTSVPGVQTSGPRTVLSPVGLNLRAGPSRAAKVLGTAAAGVVLEVVGHTGQGGGWFEVKGATVTGWITASATLSAPGKLSSYTSNSHHFGVLYPTSWKVGESPAYAEFRAPSGGETIVVANAATVGPLGRGRAGYHEIRSEQIVPCGVTTNLDTYMRSTPPPVAASGAKAAAGQYLAQIRITLDPTHALGIDANLSDLTQLQTVRDFANSITFSSPKCLG